MISGLELVEVDCSASSVRLPLITITRQCLRSESTYGLLRLRDGQASGESEVAQSEFEVIVRLYVVCEHTEFGSIHYTARACANACELV